MLQKVKTQVHYMNGQNALLYLKQFLGAWNLEKREALKTKLREAGPGGAGGVVSVPGGGA